MIKSRCIDWAEERISLLDEYIGKELDRYIDLNFDQYEAEKIKASPDYFRNRYSLISTTSLENAVCGAFNSSALPEDVITAFSLLKRLVTFEMSIRGRVSYAMAAEKVLFDDDGEYFRNILAEVAGEAEEETPSKTQS